MTQRRADRGLAWSDVIRLAIKAQLSLTHVAFPARVERYDAARNCVDVLPQLEMETECVDGSHLRERLPVVPSVPIAWPRSRAYGITFPLAVGDFVLVVACDRNIGEWRRTGQAGDPHDAGVHELDGAVAIPGLYPRADELASPALTDHLVLGRLASGGPTIHVDASEIRLGSNGATRRVALEDVDTHLAQVATSLDQIRQALATLLGGGAPVLDPNYGAAAKALLDASSPIAATRVRAE